VTRELEPGWYADPAAPGRWRWWDGQYWTEHAVGADGASDEQQQQLDQQLDLQLTTVDLANGEPAEDPLASAEPANGEPASGGPATAEVFVATAEKFVVTEAPGPEPHGPEPHGPEPRGPGTPGPVEVPGGPPRRTGLSGRPASLARRAGGGANRTEAAVFAKRWAVLVGIVLVVAIILAIALRSHAPTLYWQGEPMEDSSQVLVEAQAAMKSVASADEGALSSDSRCYFSVANSSDHDVAPYLRCGPILFPWSSPTAPWLTYAVSGTPSGSGVKVLLGRSLAAAATSGLHSGEVLRRPDGASAPKGAGGLALPVVPRQRAGWAGALSEPPLGLRSAPVGDLIGDWGQTYRLVAFGEVSYLSSKLDPAALRDAASPPGSAYATVRSSGGRPLATLLLPMKGQALVVAELALGPGEAAGAVPSEAVADGAGPPGPDKPAIEVLAGGTSATFDVPAKAAPGASPARPADLTLVASVPAGSHPLLEISDKGLVQEVSLAGGQLAPGPEVLARLGTDEPLDATGDLPGAQVHISDAALVWFAGSDGGTVPPASDEAYLEVLASASPPGSSFLPASDFSLSAPGGQPEVGEPLPDADRAAIVVGFLVPASFSNGTVTVSGGGRSFSVPVNFP
jgi:Protein of unknown function (DUF2510)